MVRHLDGLHVGRNSGGRHHELPNCWTAGERFTHLFALSDTELAAQGAVRRTADDRIPGYPCRVSLTDSKPGDELILVNYEHHAVDSPYRMRFAIYVRKGEETYDKVDEVPEQLRVRQLAVRAFDRDAMMVGWEVVDGRDLERAIEKLLPIRAPPTCMSTTRRRAATPRGWSGIENASVMARLVPAIHAFLLGQDVDARHHSREKRRRPSDG